MTTTPAAPGPIAALRRLAQSKGRGAVAEERCELCAAPVPAEHAHLMEPATRKILCACDPCAILFSESTAQKFRRVPRTIERWVDFQITDVQWEGLGVPIGLAFFFHNGGSGQIVGIYPSPGGGTQSDVPHESWEGLCEQNPALRKLTPDVEALLVNRIGDEPMYFRAPIDACYKLVGLIKTHWRGLSGGKDAWEQIKQFFRELDARSIRRGTSNA